MNIIYGKLLIAFLLSCCTIGFWVKREYIKEVFERTAESKVIGLSFVILRLIPFVIIYLIMGIEPQSDVEGFWEEASLAFEGKVVYRDFWSPYSPLYPYFLAIWLAIWYSPKTIIIVMAVVEGLAVWYSNRFYDNLLPKGERLWKSLMYLILPGSMMLCVIGGQEDVWMWFVLLIAFLLGKKKGNIGVYSWVLALGLLLTKAIFVLVIIPLFWIEKKKFHFALPMALVGVVSFVILYTLVGWEFMQPLDESKVLRAPNLMSVLNPIFFDSIGIGNKFWNWVALLFTLVLGIVVLKRLHQSAFELMISKFWVVVFTTMMIAQQSAYSNYIFLFLIPLVFVVVNWEDKKQVICLIAFNFLCVIHPSWWWRIGMPVYTDVQSILQDWKYIVDYGMQVGIVLLAVYMIRLAYPAGKLQSNPAGTSSHF